MVKKGDTHRCEQSSDGQSPSFPLCHATAKAEREHIIKILRSTDGNKTRAADILGISRKTLWEKLKVHKINT